MVPTIFVLDDDLVYAKLLAANLGSPGRVRTRVFERPDELLAHHAEEPADAVITDLVMPDLNGVEVTRRLRRTDPHLPIFVLTGHSDLATAIDALKAGATEYLTKPVNIDELMTLLTRALAARPLVEAGASLEQARGEQFSIKAILGEHPKVEAVRAFVRNMAAIPRPTVLLLGESGTGKNLVARAIHYSSSHSAGRFVEINCAALPASLLEAELFGYKRGAFTDAREAKRGLIETADGGTLFRDEIAELTPERQAKLLNVLERAMMFTAGPTLRSSDLPPLAGANASAGRARDTNTFALPKRLSLADAEREYIRLTLEETDGDIQRAAELLGISRKNLWEKRKKYGLLPTASDAQPSA